MRLELFYGLLVTATDINPADMKPGWVGGVVVFGLVAVVALLMWSFVRQTRRAREPWPGDAESTDESEDTNN